METYDFDSITGGVYSFDSGNTSGASGSSPSADGDNLLMRSPFGVLSEVLGEEGLSTIFSGLGGSAGSNPFGGGSSSMNSNLADIGDPFSGENFWNIFAGGVNPDNVSSFAGGGGNSSFGGF